MVAFFSGALWALALALWCYLAWPLLGGDAVSAESGGYGKAVSIEDEPYAYWKCWRTGTEFGYGFTNRAKGPGGGGFATPYQPDWAGMKERGQILPADGTDDGRWQETRSRYMDARFYRSPGLRDGDYRPLRPDNAAAFKPFGDDGGDGSFFDSTSTLPKWNPWVVVADPRISKLEITWDTHTGGAGEGSIDEVLRAQQEQVADTETAEHLVYRQGPYRGPSSASGGVLSSYAPVYEVGNLGTAQPDVGYRVQTGFEEDQVMVLSGTSYTSSSGGNTTTTYNISSQPRNVTNEVSITNRNSAQHPEVNAAQVTVQSARVVLNQIGTTGYYDDSRTDSSVLARALTDRHGAFHSVPGYQFAVVVGAGGVATTDRACFVVADPATISGGGGHSREYRGYCWMVRAGATPSRTKATQNTSSLGVSLPPGNTGVDARSAASYIDASWGPHFTIPVYETGSEPAADDSVLEANTPAERQDALDPVVADDGPNDALIVAIDLKGQYRRDPKTDYNLSDGSGNNDYRWNLFGSDRLEPRYHWFGNGEIQQVGYNQSYMVPPFLDTKGDSDFKKSERILPYLYDHEGAVEGLGLESMFLWPVRLDEMNYYLFRVPGFTHDHLRDRGHIMNLAYAHSAGVDENGINANFLGITAGITKRPMGEAVLIPTEVEGTSGRTDFGFTAHQLNPFASGKVYYPFYDLDIYQDQTVKPSSGSPYGGNADAGYAHGGAGVLLSRSMLVKAGVTAPIDRGDGADQYGNNATFRFQIEEGLPVGMPEGGGREDVLDRLGFSPSYLAAKKDGQDPLESAWPNARINPDDTHLLLVTFYEGRIAGEWRIQNAVDVPVVGNVGLPEWGAKAGQAVGAVKELGSVPRFQFRRVMCRVLVPADGVVTPASGFEGVKEKLGEVRDKVVGALAGVVDRLIGWLEDLPKQFMETGTKVAVAATCEGAGFIDTLGDNVPARYESGGGGVADVGLSGVEADSYLGEEQCRQVAAEATARTGDCTDVGRAVDDPACRGVPSVGFRAWDVSFGTTVATLSSNGTEGRDDYYGARWLPRFGSEYKDVQLVPYATDTRDEDWVDRMVSNAVSLPDSVDTDLGVGAARFEFDFDNVDLLYRRPDSSGVDGVLQARATGIDWPKEDGNDFLQRRSSGRFDGYILYVRPDPKAGWYHDRDTAGKTLKARLDEIDGNPYRDAVLTSPGSELRFVLPLYYLQFGNRQFTGKTTVRRVPGFDIGPVLGHSGGRDCRYTHIGILSQLASAIGEPLPTGFRHIDATTGARASGAFGCDGEGWRDDYNHGVAFVGASDWAHLDAYLSRLWYLGDGYRYQFALSAYRGMPGVDDSWVEGPRSDWVSVSGGAELACRDEYVLATRWADNGDDPAWRIYQGNPDYDDYKAVYDRYDCGVLLASGGALERFGPGSDYYEAYWNEFLANSGESNRLASTVQRGVLGAQAAPDLSGIYESTSLVGSRVCGNFWNGTPSGQTWNSPVTRTIWHVSWVLAMLLLFVLLLWDGLTLTYQGMLSDGRGGVTLRTMLPRFGLALLLAASSLLICRVVLTLASDVTCYVSHATGMTFWGFLGTVIGGVLWETIQLFWGVGAAGLVGIAFFGVGTIAVVAFLVIVLFVLLIALWYAFKVFAGMVARILLLLILCGLSPVAMAMYASPSTEHWTKKWVSMFLGAAFQQVVVLMVLYCGAALAKSFVGDYDVTNWFGHLLNLIMVLFTLFFAARVPDLINPGGKGLFSGLGQALMMAGAAAMIIASAGMGAAAAGLMGSGSALRGLAGSVGNMFGGGGGGASAGMVGAAPAGGPSPAAGASPMTGLGGGGTSFTGMSNQQPGGGTAGVQPGGWQSTQPGGQSVMQPGGDPGTTQPGGDPSVPPAVAGGDPGGAQPSGDLSVPATTAGGDPSVTAPAATQGGDPGRDAADMAGAAGAAAAGGGLGGWLARVARGAQYGAARGQRGARYLETYGRGYLGRPPERSYSRTAPVDLQSFRNFVNKQPLSGDPQAQSRLAQNRESRGQGISPPIYGRGRPDGNDPNHDWHANAGHEGGE